jgi:EAL domain-containing protein (putative c-di-GMP-specific phosphodiesterase class I)
MTKPDRRVQRHDLATEANNGHFDPMYVPQLDARSGRLVGVDVHARVNVGGVVQHPSEFAQQLDAAGALDAMAFSLLNKVLADLGHWRVAGLRLKVTFSLPPSIFQELLVADDLITCVALQRLQASDIVFECPTDIAGLHNGWEGLVRLRAQGFGLAKGVLATAHRAWHPLSAEIPFTDAKIDANLAPQTVDAQVTRARRAALRVHATAVASVAALNHLSALDIDTVQGPLFSSAVDASGVIELAARWRSGNAYLRSRLMVA